KNHPASRLLTQRAHHRRALADAREIAFGFGPLPALMPRCCRDHRADLPGAGLARKLHAQARLAGRSNPSLSQQRHLTPIHLHLQSFLRNDSCRMAFRNTLRACVLLYANVRIARAANSGFSPGCGRERSADMRRPGESPGARHFVYALPLRVRGFFPPGGGIARALCKSFRAPGISRAVDLVVAEDHIRSMEFWIYPDRTRRALRAAGRSVQASIQVISGHGRGSAAAARRLAFDRDEAVALAFDHAVGD